MFCCFQYNIRNWRKKNILNDFWGAGAGILQPVYRLPYVFDVLEIGLFSLFPFLQAFHIGSGAHLTFCLMDIIVGAISRGWSKRNVKLTIHPTWWRG